MFELLEERDSPTLIFRLCTPTPLPPLLSSPPLPPPHPIVPVMSHSGDGDGARGVISGPGSPELIIRQLAISLQALRIVCLCERPPAGTLFSYSISSSLQMMQWSFQAQADRHGSRSEKVTPPPRRHERDIPPHERR